MHTDFGTTCKGGEKETMIKVKRYRRKRKITETEVMAWAENHPKVKTWLAKVQTPEHRGYLFAMFCDWSGLSPEELYALKDDPKSLEAEYLLDRFVADKEAPFTESVKWGIIQAVKSFFSHNYRDLAKKSGKIIVTKKRPERKPSKEELVKLWKACYTPRDRALITFVNSTAIAKETLDLLQWKEFEKDWEEQEIPCIVAPPEKLKGHGVGRWQGVKQVTFLTPEAKEALIEYREWIQQKMGRKLTEDDYVWLSSYKPYKPLTHSGLGMLIWKLARRAGVEFSWHDARRYVETALEEAKINPNWARKIRGRKIRGEESPYSKPAIEQLRAAFREVVPKLQFLTTPTKPIVTREELRAEMAEMIPLEYWERMAKKHGKSIEEMKRIWRTKKMLKKSKTETNGGIQRDCQKIVSEEELPSLLAQGWRVSVVLPSGKIVVEKNDN